MSSYLKFNPTFKTNTSKCCQNISRGNYIVVEGFDEEKKKELQDTIVKKLKQYKVNVVKLEDVINESISKTIIEIINDPALNILNRVSLMPVIAARTERWLDVKKYLDNGFWVISTGLDLAAIIDSKNENVNLSEVLFFFGRKH
ncbi:MAG: hypothetical protein Q3996_00945 [Candidatus Saccharibacteria bacterium]|nr:hypothetical protein [Candidatus Saccharibacteria bacterium]